MSQVLILKAKGLNSNANQLGSDLPEGALAKADNCVIDKDGVIESRRGFENLEADSVSALDRFDSLSSYGDNLIAHRSNDDVLSYFDGVTWTDYSGTYPSSDKMKFAEMNGNKYFTTDSGVMVLDDVAGPVYGTGMPKGLDGVASVTGASGFLADDSAVAYRVVWGTRDANNNLYLGSPSQRILVANTAGATRDVSLTFTIPSGISTSDFFQVYRGGQSVTAATEPNDEMQVVYESNPSAGEITAKSVTFTDSTDDSLKGAFLYSNSNQEGISESNDIPPKATDICMFKNFLFFSNVTTKHFIDISFLSVGGTSGLVVDDTITIDGMVFTAKASENIASRQFKVTTSGSASQNIDDTARSLVKVVNQYSSNTSVYAYYTSGYADLPGQITIEARTLSASSFAVSVSRATCWDINDGTSDNSEYPHGIMWSKIQQPEHVPSAHLEFVGSKSNPIKRILALKDSLFILKTDGIWRLSGTNGQWSIEPHDTSTKIVAPESAVVLNNQIFALTDQGVVTISDIGVAVISRPIEDKITEVINRAVEVSFAVAYETDRKYILWCPTSEADTYPTQAFVYNTFTRVWTRWDKEASCGIIFQDKLDIALPTSKYILRERKTFSYRDYIDEEIQDFVYSISSFTGAEVVLNTIEGLTVGDLVYESSTVYSPIVSIDGATNTITVNDEKTWNIAAVSIFKGINTQVEWANQSCQNPGVEKFFQEVALLFRQQQFSAASLSFYTDNSGGYESQEVLGNYGGGTWGSFPWGSIPWGGVQRPAPVRVAVPLEKNRGTLISIKFTHRIGFGVFSLNGLSLQFDFVSERMNNS